MKARKVKKLDPDATLFEGGRRIVRVRLDELFSFERAPRDPEAVEELHDLRIAAKRLRYVLEITGPAFGAGAADGARVARKLQDVLGEIHDCDEMLPRVEAHLDRLRIEDAEAARKQAKGAAKDLPPAAALAAPNRDRYRGLATLSTQLRARREVLYARFRRDWKQLEAQGFRSKLEQAIDEPARAAGRTARPTPAPQPARATMHALAADPRRESGPTGPSSADVSPRAEAT